MVAFDISLICMLAPGKKEENIWDELEGITQTMKEEWLLKGNFIDILTTKENIDGTLTLTRKCINFQV